jgi:hypothetical protein
LRVIALSLSSIQRAWGVDVGRGKATGQFSDSAIEVMEKASGAKIRPNIHGLDVFEDSGNILRFSVSGAANVSAVAKDLLGGVAENFERFAYSGGAAEYHERFADLGGKEYNAVRLVNQAMMTGGAASLVIAVAAVESLCPDLAWTSSQRAGIDHLIKETEKLEGLSEEEKAELSAAIKRMHPLSIRQGMKRLLTTLDLAEIWHDWDDVYNRRSRFFHGGIPPDSHEINALASDAVRLAKIIVLESDS